VGGTAETSTALEPPARWAWLTALGVVFCDLGTSPLYTLQTVIGTLKGPFTPETGIGILSLIVWTLIITISRFTQPRQSPDD
jgi:KUP system potassium uptake protein